MWWPSIGLLLGKVWSWVIGLGVSVVGRKHLLLVVLCELGGVGLGCRLGLHGISGIVIHLVVVWVHLLLVVLVVSALALVLAVDEVITGFLLFIIRSRLLLLIGFRLLCIRLLSLTASLSLKKTLLGLVRGQAQESGHLLRY